MKGCAGGNGGKSCFTRVLLSYYPDGDNTDWEGAAAAGAVASAADALTGVSMATSATAVTRTAVGGRAAGLQSGLQAAGRRRVAARASDRPIWYPGGDAPKHLDGSLPGKAAARLPREPPFLLSLSSA